MTKKNIDIINMKTEFQITIPQQQQERLRKLYAIPYDKFYEHIWNVKNERRGEQDDELFNNPKTYFKRLKDWLISIFKVDSGIIKEKYKYSKYTNKKVGRLFVDGFGFQSFSREIRNFVFGGLDFYDYDMKNAHFKIVKYLIRDTGLETPILDKYINERKKCLKKWNVSKTDVLTMLNCDKWYNGSLKKFHQELMPVKLIINTTYTDICNKTTNDKNPISSITNKILCDFENKLLQKQMEAQQNAHSIYFDGYIGTDKKDIAELNKITQEEGIEWDVKPFDEPIFNIDEIYDKVVFDDIDNINHYKFSKKKMKDLLNKCDGEMIRAECADLFADLQKKHKTEKKVEKEFKKVLKQISQKRKERVLEYFNDYYCVIKGSKMTYLREEKDKYNRMESYTIYSSKKDFNENHIEYTITNEYLFSGSKRVADLWLGWCKRRTYDKVVFRPYEYFDYDPDDFNTYNMWSGWRFEYDENYIVDEKLIENILHHMKVVLCKGNNEMFQYVLNLWKLILLGKKTGIGLGITGIQGCGKSTIIEYFGTQIIGEKYYAYVQSLEDLTNKFSSLRCMKSFIVVDEIDTWSGDTKTANKLKSMLTQTKTKLENKNKDPINIDDFANFAFISNFENFLRVEGKNDRRYLIQEADSCKTGNKKYFNKLNIDLGSNPLNRKLTKQEKIHSTKVAKTFFHYLMNRDLTDFDTRDIPQTEILKDMKQECSPVIVSYVWKVLQAIVKSNTKQLRVSDLFIKYEDFCKDTLSNQKYGTSACFSRRLKKSFKIFKKYIVHKRDGSTFEGFKKSECENMIKQIELKYMFSNDIEKYEMQMIQHLDVEENEESDSDSDDDIDL